MAVLVRNWELGACGNGRDRRYRVENVAGSDDRQLLVTARGQV
jgi:hypothetical protein